MPHQTNGETTNQPENGTSTRSTKPVTTFGLLTDIQYADVEDGMSYDKTRHRYYRNSLNLVSEAVKNWKQHEIDNEVKLQFLLQLGDIVDLQAFAKNESEISLDKVMSELNKLFPVPVDQDGGAKEPEQKILHLWGNHEMYNWRRKGSLAGSVLNTARRLQQEHVENTNCFVYEVTDKLRLVCLDFYKSAIIGYEETDPEYVTALDYLRSHNKNEDLNSAEGK
jgi:manganese-dependent ADP-ribose/CDP-alcohol diphosphatase